MEQIEMFENLVDMMGLNVDEVPSIHIEDKRDNIPEWIINFVRDLFDYRFDKTVQVGLLDILGTYSSEKKTVQVGLLDILGTYSSEKKMVTVYPKVVEMCAHRLQVDSQTLGDVVMAHELAHAATHLGIDGDGKIWVKFETARIDAKEYFAQWYSHRFWSILGFQSHEDLMLKLVDVQPKIYSTYHQDIRVDLETTNSRLLVERHKIIEGMENKLCEFCKIRIATEEVARWDTWLRSDWSIPACSVCAPHHQQTWFT
ncbi:hypothetical protein [Methylococcus geothermalis]|uniref:Uncharacterized protein n=1 Tax=Methylococcus geothermalis TaxID=2681310 RepID=A0A858Q5C4_9GAMM|nr:hypothetical protein [Methylococcus geothermalis]QJD29029.1 hypothetical protein GNH96_02950 [Methylococcus geothermalis]